MAETDGENTSSPIPSPPVDNDGDGFSVSGGDCNDNDNTVSPSAREICGDSQDDDCDGVAQPCSVQTVQDLSQADVIYIGNGTDDIAGTGLCMGDLDGDGHDDLVVWGQKTSTGSSGTAYMVHGSEDTNTSPKYLYTERDRITSDAGANIGSFLASGHDITGDGLDDLLVKGSISSQGDSSAGGVLVYPGPIESTQSASTASLFLAGVNNGDSAGNALTMIGDFNGDGDSDLAIGAPGLDDGSDDTNEGGVYLLYDTGGGSISLEDSSAILVGEGSLDKAGGSVAAAGDVNGDGIDDLLVGAPDARVNASPRGAAYLVFGRQLSDELTGMLGLVDVGTRLATEEKGAGFGGCLAGNGDINGDDFSDFAIGAWGADAETGSNAGKVYLYCGSSSGAEPCGEFFGETTDDAACIVAFARVRGSKLTDIVVGAGGNDRGGSGAGATYLFYSPIVDTTYALASADHIILGEESGDASGNHLSIGDFNGDAYDDILLGVPYNSRGGSHAGAVFLLLGGPEQYVAGTSELTCFRPPHNLDPPAIPAYPA